MLQYIIINIEQKYLLKKNLNKYNCIVGNIIWGK